MGPTPDNDKRLSNIGQTRGESAYDQDILELQ
jgi:hypothetical protein